MPTRERRKHREAALQAWREWAVRVMVQWTGRVGPVVAGRVPRMWVELSDQELRAALLDHAALLTALAAQSRTVW